MIRPQAEATIQIENEQVRVTRYTFAPGAETGRHRHGFDYVVVPITIGTLTIDIDGTASEADLQIGEPYNRAAGVEHNVINNTEAKIVFIEIELLEHPE